MSTTPLDILCEVAADAESVQQLPPLRAAPQEAPPPRLPPLSAPPYRLSSSAPTNPGFLSNPTLPKEPPLTFHNTYYVPDSSIPSNTPASFPGYAVSYPHPVLHPPRHPPPLSRNLSAPSLTDRACASVPLHTMLVEESYRVSRTPSQNIPVPRPVATVVAQQGLSPPLYGSPSSSSISRMRGASYTSGPLKSVGRSGKTTGRRDSYTRFTQEEEAMLMEGVRVYGVGNWKKILNTYRFHWKRTAVDLKDKYRNMTRAKTRRLNASSASDLSSVGSDDGRAVQGLSPLQNDFLLSKTAGLGISPVTTANNTPAGSVEEREKVMRSS